MRVLLTGANGQLGRELAHSLVGIGDVFALDRIGADLCDLDGLRAIVQEIQPDCIVNAAAYTAVDKAESDEGVANIVNGEAPGVLAEEARRLGALLVHYSTDYVFDGTKNTPYTERDDPHPINAYGRSKVAGERAVESVAADYLILRTSGVYGGSGHNFVNSILGLAREREELRIVADQVGAPTWARAIANASAHVVRHAARERQTGAFESGIFHLVSSGETSWYGFALAIVERWASLGLQPPLKVKRIVPIATVDYPTPARRPGYSVLAAARIGQRFGVKMASWESLLEQCMAEYPQPTVPVRQAG